MEREVRYCTTEDGVRIAYCVEGRGSPLVITPYLLESFFLHEVFPAFAAFMRGVADGHTSIRYDSRGTGLSERRIATGFSVADGGVRDLEAVVDAAGVDAFALFGSCAGGQVALAYAHRHPERVKRLALYGTYPGVRHFWSPEMIRSFSELARANWPMAVRAFGDISLRDVEPEKATQQGEMMLQSLSGETFADGAMATYEFDLIPILPEVSVPTLIIHRMDDAGVPFHLAQEMAAIIPNARLVPVPGKANQPAGGDPRPILNALHAFLDEDPETRALAVPPTSASAPDSAFRAVLFTDLVGHTEMMSRLGDERGRDVLREHERITREVLKQHAGTEVKTMGDGFMASFASVTKAVECAVALQRAFDARNTTDPNPGVRFQPDRGGVGDTASVPGQSPVEPLNVRVGLNAGEPIEEEGPDGRSDLFGATVILASRIAARAEGGEILVSDNVRSLCSGKNFLFADRGDFTAKGFEDPVHIYEVSWRT